jgi:nitrogen-specific signal transduction histidine kinase
MFEFWCEYDINPLIIFSSSGELLYCNQEAEILLSYISTKEIFEFTIKNAPKEKGIKTVFEKIVFKEFEFNGYSIGYKDNDKIGVRFFINTNKHHIYLQELEKLDLTKILNLTIEYTKLKQNTKFKIFFDPSIPEIYINKKEIISLLIEAFKDKKEVEIQTKINIGEYLKIANKKYQIIEIHINHPLDLSSEYFEILKKEKKTIIQIPLIKEKH